MFISKYNLATTKFNKIESCWIILKRTLKDWLFFFNCRKTERKCWQIDASTSTRRETSSKETKPIFPSSIFCRTKVLPMTNWMNAKKQITFVSAWRWFPVKNLQRKSGPYMRDKYQHSRLCISHVTLCILSTVMTLTYENCMDFIPWWWIIKVSLTFVDGYQLFQKVIEIYELLFSIFYYLLDYIY